MTAVKKTLLVFLSCIGLCVAGWALLIGAVFAWGGVMTVHLDNPDGPNFAVPLPMAVVDAAVSTGELVFDDLRLDLGEWEPMVAEVMAVIEDCPDVTFIEVEDHGDYVRVAKEDGYLKVEVSEDGAEGAKFRVSLPARVATRTISRLIS